MASRVSFDRVEGIDKFFTKDFLDFLVQAVDLFNPSIESIRRKRSAMLKKALKESIVLSIFKKIRFSFSRGVASQKNLPHFRYHQE